MTLASSDKGVSHQDTLRRTADIVATYVANNRLPASAIPGLVRTVLETLTSLSEEPAKAPPVKQKPAVPINRSVRHDHLICLEDGKKLTMLKRYLSTHYDMSPEEYRSKWGLPADYPMVAPDYATRRAAFAKSIGLGTGVRRKPTR